MGQESLKRSRFQHRIPTLETLESRLLTTVENLEYQLQELQEPPAAPEVSAITRVVRNSFNTLSAPRFVRSINANTSRVGIDGSITLSTLGTDSSGERNLSYHWRVEQAPPGANPSFSRNASNAAKTTQLSLDSVGEYRISVTMVNRQGASISSSIRLKIAPTVTRMEVRASDDEVIRRGATVESSSTVQSLKLKAFDQFGNEMGSPSQFRVIARAAAGGGFTRVMNRGEFTDINFDRLANYRVTIFVGRLSTAFTVRVVSSVSRVEIVPPTDPIQVGETVQFTAKAFDQFGREIFGNFSQQWSVDQGSITNRGLFTTPNLTTTVNVTLRSGDFIANLSLNVSGAVVSERLGSQDLSYLLTQYFADGSIDRMEMMALLRLPGKDGVVTAQELGDLKYIVENGQLYNIPDYVLNLASDVVHGNVANQTFQGKRLGNLTAGSSAWQLNTLVDKWFLGTDVPALTSTRFVYQYTVGNLFQGEPSFMDQKQGMLGDCYFISALGSLAYVNPAVITDMFIDNGDGTFTVRFYGGTYGAFYNPDGTISDGFAYGTQAQVDYVTVDRRLPVYAGTRLAYSGYGNDYRSNSNALWIALAEKAYAQWNETGNSGRNGANTYDAIQGGWMATVYAQVLGQNATNYWFSHTPKQTLINAINSGQSVTLGTKTGPMIGGLVPGHAYMVKAYDARTDRFILHNPWGTSHPASLNYTQLQQYCSVFVVARAALNSQVYQTQVRYNVRSDIPLELIAMTDAVGKQDPWRTDDTNVTKSLRSQHLLFKPQQNGAQDVAIHDWDSELRMISELTQNILEIRNDLSHSVREDDADAGWALAVDELFLQEEFLRLD